MRVSVVISTLDRAESLVRTIRSLRLQTHDEVEVVVVNGPSSDDSAARLAALDLPFKSLTCPLPNLSMSRNIGIRAAAGDVIAFIDDDALPEPTWLEEALPSFDDAEVAGVGGIVFDNTGLSLQYAFSAADRLGEATFRSSRPFDELCSPGSWQFPYLQGTNALFRRDVLREIGLFDEQYEYYLDETDVCVRMVDAGYVLRQLRGAPVHHKFLPSDVRNEHRVVRNWFPVVKNRMYFGLKHARPERVVREVLDDNERFVERCLADVATHVAAGRLPEGEVGRAHDQMAAALEIGLRRGLNDLPPERLRVVLDPPPFLPFPTRGRSPGRRCVVIASRDYPPEGTGGIATLTAAAASGLAAAGHEVRVVAHTAGAGHVDLDGDVWVHRIPDAPASEPVVAGLRLPGHAAARMRAVEREVSRIAETRQVDLVYGPIWDSETLALAGGSTLPLVTHAETTMTLSLGTREDWRLDEAFRRQVADPLVAAERALVGSSLAIHAISEAIGGTIRSEYGAPAGSVTVVPIALPDLVDDAAEASEPSPAGDDVRSPVRILFVGRLEPRKGLDALLAAAAEIVGERSDVEFDLAGDDSIVVAGGETYRARFERDLGDREQSARVRFHGVVDERRLDELYRSCDVFVAPSRYESFGLVFLEAMQRGKPVVGTRVGGVPEVVRDLVDGLLVDPDDPAALRSAILTLVDDADRRAAMGESGRMRVRGELSLDRYVAGLEALFARIRQIGPDAAIEVTGDVDDVIVDGRPALALGAAGRVVVALPPCAARRVAVVVSDGPATVRVGRGGSARDVLLGEAGVHRLDIGSGDVVDGTVELARRDEGEGACTVVAIHVLEEVPPCASPS